MPAAASRPFDRGRDGFVLGEGAWMMVLEREEDARARGAQIYAFVEGYGSTCDAYHRVQMDPDGTEIIRAMTLALERVRPREGRDRLRQLSRHVDAVERRDRSRVRQAAVRRARGAAAGVVHQVDGRPPAGRERRLRHRDHRAGARPEVSAADDQSGRSRSGAATSTSSRTRVAPRRRARRCATAWASARRTARSCWARPSDERAKSPSPLPLSQGEGFIYFSSAPRRRGAVDTACDS